MDVLFIIYYILLFSPFTTRTSTNWGWLSFALTHEHLEHKSVSEISAVWLKGLPDANVIHH